MCQSVTELAKTGVVRKEGKLYFSGRSKKIVKVLILRENFNS